MPDRQLFSRNAASAAHFRSARVNYVRLIESADRRFMSDRIAGIFFFRPIPAPPANPPSCPCRHQPFPLSPVNLRFARRFGTSPETPFRRKVFEKSHRCSRCPILDIADDRTHRTQTRTRISYRLISRTRLSFKTP